MLKLEKINKKTGNFSLVDIDFTVEKGDYFVLIGESGAGKSLLLETITGILTPDSGDILLNGKSILNTPIQKRNMGMVYQKAALFPHMTVFDNIAYPLKIRKIGKEAIKAKVNKLAQDTEISQLLNRNTCSLSGGEAQRVAIARTLATNPIVLLLDEPMSFLDAQLRRGMRSLLRKLNQQGQTIIHVTHDYEEALSLTNKIAIIEKGVIVQSGTPMEVFHHPSSVFVANFIGIGNFYEGRLEPSSAHAGLNLFKTGETKIYINAGEVSVVKGYITIPGESITISEEKIQSSAVNNFQGIISEVYRTIRGLEVVVDVGIQMNVKISEYSFDQLHLKTGKQVWISIKASSVQFFRS